MPHAQKMDKAYNRGRASPAGLQVHVISCSVAQAIRADGRGRSSSPAVGWSLTVFSTQCRSYRAFKVRLY